MKPSPIAFISSAHADPLGFLRAIRSHGDDLRLALTLLRDGDTAGYRRIMTTAAGRANVERWRSLPSLRQKAFATLPPRASRRELLTMVTSGGTTVPTSTKREVLKRKNADRCWFCGVALVMPDDWNLLRRHSPCVLPGAIRIDGVARSNNGGALNIEQRAPMIGYRHQFEHLVPRAIGGSHLPPNIVSACGWCNSAKGTRTLEELGLPYPKR